MTTLFITEEQKKKLSAMDQVGNKVNAGIMDAVTCGGMCEEGAEPESDEYEIGFEEDANSYAHTINESPDVAEGNMDLRFLDSDAICFVTPVLSPYKKSSGENYPWEGRMFVSWTPGITHYDFIGKLMEMGADGDPDGIDYPPMVRNWIDEDLEYTGRFWVYSDLISFYEGFGVSNIDNFRQLRATIEQLYEQGVNINSNNLLIDVWGYGSNNGDRLVPYEWFKCGLAQKLLDGDPNIYIYPSKPREYRTNGRYTEFTVKSKVFGDKQYNLYGEEIMDDWKQQYFKSIEDEKEEDEEEESFWNWAWNSSELYESVGENFNLEESMVSLIRFIASKINIEPFPSIHLNDAEQDGLFIKTGYYLPDEKSVTLFTAERHPKDILRSLAHELIHHNQNLENPDRDWGTGGNLEDDKVLEKLEADAFLRGNLLFRQWTETQKPRKALNEEKIMQGLDFSTFSVKDNLNPKFWKDGHLDSRIRLKLLDIADALLEYLGADMFDPVDIIMTGSLANYNWNKSYSDIDLHIVIDYDDIDEDKDFVKKYIDAAMTAWDSQHNDLTIYGFPVECYVQDASETHQSSGIYSLQKDEWVKEPDHDEIADYKLNKAAIRKKVAVYMRKINDLEKKLDGADSDYDYRTLSKQIEDTFASLKKDRKDGLKHKNSEMSNGNIMYKALRRKGYLDKIITLRQKVYDKSISLNEQNK